MVVRGSIKNEKILVIIITIVITINSIYGKGSVVIERIWFKVLIGHKATILTWSRLLFINGKSITNSATALYS